MSTFSHLNAGGEANMVDVSDKDVTKREATAEGFLYVSEDVIRQISESKIAKRCSFAVIPLVTSYILKFARTPLKEPVSTTES